MRCSVCTRSDDNVAQVVLRNNTIVADIRSAAYGHTLGGAVGLAMVVALQNLQADACFPVDRIDSLSQLGVDV